MYDKIILTHPKKVVYVQQTNSIPKMSGHIKVKVAGKIRNVWVTDTKNCKDYKCFHPHDCPIQGASGVRNSQERWMCLTNLYHGCPDKPEKKLKT